MAIYAKRLPLPPDSANLEKPDDTNIENPVIGQALLSRANAEALGNTRSVKKQRDFRYNFG